MNYKIFLADILKKASGIANRRFGKVSGTTKAYDKNQVLTETDIEIGNFIAENIKKFYPTHNIIDEELGVIDHGSEYTWVVDPIDGTSNFAAGVPTYGIMMGLLHNAMPIAGGIALPYFKNISIAEKGKGATSDGKRITVSKEKDLIQTLIAYHWERHREDFQETREESKIVAEVVLKARNIRSSSSAFDIVMVAKGGYGGAVNQTSKIWDNVAPHILIEEAGGKYTDFFGEPMDYTHPLKKAKINFTFCAASPRVHAQLQKIIQKFR